jgi:hypothetical protein
MEVEEGLGEEESKFVGGGEEEDDMVEHRPPPRQQQQHQRQPLQTQQLRSPTLTRVTSSGDGLGQTKRGTTKTAGGMNNSSGGGGGGRAPREIHVEVEEEDYVQEEDDDLSFAAMESGSKKAAVAARVRGKGCGGNYYLGTSLLKSPPPFAYIHRWRARAHPLQQEQCPSGRTS